MGEVRQMEEGLAQVSLDADVKGGGTFETRRGTYLTLQPCHREQNTEESRG